jgi:hypothetical protein
VDEPSWACHVDTQHWLRAGGDRRCADLELTFRRSTPTRRTLHLRVEVKHGTPPHTGQLQAYIDEQRSVGDDAAVLLLAPRQDYPFEPAQVPDEVVQLRWQDTARIIREWSTDDPVGRFLLAELTAYLREEDLVDPEDLTGEHLVALDVHREALNALERCASSRRLVSTRDGTRVTGPGSGDPVLSRSAGGHTRRTPGSRRPRASTSMMPGDLHGS